MKYKFWRATQTSREYHTSTEEQPPHIFLITTFYVDFLSSTEILNRVSNDPLRIFMSLDWRPALN